MDKTLIDSIKKYSKELGFSLFGITRPEQIQDIEFYKKFLEDGFDADMTYLRNYLDKREYPSLLFEGVKSIICVGLNYYYPFEENKQNEYKIAKYALGKDYHIFMKEKLNYLLAYIKEIYPNADGKICVDTAPVLEKSLAQRAGLGWIGKNTLLVSYNKGSYFLLGELFLNIELEYDEAEKNHCGNCRKCVDSCPTKALFEPYKLNSNLCLSYQTIESKKEIPKELISLVKNNLFGCDICQDVCPWNKKFAKASDITEIMPNDYLKEKTLEDLLELEQEEFSKIFKNTAIKRSKLRGIIRNAISVAVCSKNKKYIPILKKLTEHNDTLVKNQAMLGLEILFSD